MRSEGLFPAFQHHYRHRKRREKEVEIKSSISELVLLEKPPAKPSCDNAGKQFNMNVWNTKRDLGCGFKTDFHAENFQINSFKPKPQRTAQTHVCSTTKFRKLPCA